VFVLTSADTCSASESIVNGLRGAGVTVHLIGSTTCGKPYGFTARQLRHHLLRDPVPGVNFLGFGDYADGFSHLRRSRRLQPRLGDPPRTSSRWRRAAQTGACTPPTSMRAQALVTRKIDSGRC
jgi:hypothetical protein